MRENGGNSLFIASGASMLGAMRRDGSWKNRLTGVLKSGRQGEVCGGRDQPLRPQFASWLDLGDEHALLLVRIGRASLAPFSLGRPLEEVISP